MHGIIFYELKKFVEEKYGGRETWDKLLKGASLFDSMYFPNEVYPDSDIVKILTVASSATGKSIDTLQEEFGEFIVPDLVKTYGAYIKKEWSFFDFLENIENAIHGTVRRNAPGAEPPKLWITRDHPSQVTIHYTSERNMRGVLRGILNGVINVYNVRVKVREINEPAGYILKVQAA